MGSGAFLVAACRYLAGPSRRRSFTKGVACPTMSHGDRVVLRREIASRCLFGVDLNPMAVQLARLSLWLATLAADKPLSFLDHHLVAGHSLIGATPEDMTRQPAAGSTERRQERLPLFDETDSRRAFEMPRQVRRPRPSRTIPRMHRSRQRAGMDTLRTGGTRRSRNGRLLDLWCAAWFWSDGTPPDRARFASWRGHLIARRTLAERLVGRCSLHARDVPRLGFCTGR